MRTALLGNALLTVLFAVSPALAEIQISGKPTANMSCSGGICTPTAKNAVLNAEDLANMLASGDVTVMSDNQALDIEFKSGMRWNSPGRLTLSSYRYLTFDKPIVANALHALTIATNTAGSNVYLTYLKFAPDAHIVFETLQTDLTIDGAQYCLKHTIRQMAKALKNHHACHAFALAKSYDASGDKVYPHAPLSDVELFEGFGNAISNLHITSATEGDVIGFIGESSGTIRNLKLPSINIAASSDGQTVGGVVGRFKQGGFNNPVADCHVTGQITAGNSSWVGGLIGSVTGDALVIDSSADVAISAGNEGYVGGLIGSNANGGVVRTYATGSVIAGDDTIAGGLIGLQNSPEGRGIWDSYATGSVSGGNNASVGGLVGFQDETEGLGSAVIFTSYSTGGVSGNAGASIGGLIGTHSVASSLTNTYWDLDTSGVSDPSQGAGNISNDPGITGLTDAQLKSGLPAGFDNKTWKQSAAFNNGYPYLIGNPPR